jgi:hypothetical protein
MAGMIILFFSWSVPMLPGWNNDGNRFISNLSAQSC